jgi:hypothetical protein
MNKAEAKGILRKFLSFLPRLWTNWITLLGTAITTVAGCTIVLALAAGAVAEAPKPYTSALAFLIMPAVFILGLLLIPVGFLWERVRKRKDKPLDPIQAAFRAAVQDKSARRRIMFVGLATFLNIVIIGAAGHHALVFMDSPEFCGELCHSAMEPENQAYLRSPHSRVACVDCHIGPGASWAVKSKLSGLRQVWAVTVGSFQRPIPTPVKELRPARDTCEQCHWPAKFHGNRIAFYTHYGEDEKNTPEVTAVLLKVGGENPRTGEYHGIHWHVSPDVEVIYQELDDKREKIGKVVWKEKGKVVDEYLPQGDQPEPLDERIMDCVDCHNRPTHIFDESPAHALDRGFETGLLDVATPFLRKISVGIISREDTNRDNAEKVFKEELAAVYARDYPDVKVTQDQILKAAKGLARLYRENIFPKMKIGWETYPSHLGHRGEEVDTRGCFRCHDEKHQTKDGKTLSQDCDLCHEILHEEENPEDLPDSLRALMPGAE